MEVDDAPVHEMRVGMTQLRDDPDQLGTIAIARVRQVGIVGHTGVPTMSPM